MQKEGFFPFPDSNQDPNVRGESPYGMEFHKDIAFTLASGVKTVSIDSEFGKGNGEVIGIIGLKTKDSTNKVLSFSAVPSATAGKVDVTVESTDATATTALVLSFFLFGQIVPQDV
jgi:hypothetical protein